jgi:hypothetical protein
MDLAVIGPIQTTGDMSTYTWALAGKDGNAVVKGRGCDHGEARTDHQEIRFFDT